MASFSPAVSIGAPEGHQDRFACHSLFSATCLKFIIVASQLPQQQLGGLFKPKWYLRAVRRHIEITHTHTLCFSLSLSLHLTHTQLRRVKAASKSNHGDQSTAVIGAKHKVMPLMKCLTISETMKQLSTFHPKFAASEKAALCGSSLWLSGLRHVTYSVSKVVPPLKLCHISSSPVDRFFTFSLHNCWKQPVKSIKM